MVAQVSLASIYTSDTEPTTIGVSGIQFGGQIPNNNTCGAVCHDTVSGGQAGSK
ncbi:hypothetical protein HYPSUDRAFT_44824 [Hypholoma sublateritium FD-334 SS-4]|uniref:Uncharacterized protein n=1 Tax=Hypholoma sublateritium (strain FD-334 SS-4) TaxID=945553 RepID=A0A0D2NPX9_HYPSF|nr:hypothetical protein HYPSUDRAFT_44824 [Hypholoma sublateritium FD-334 SS-4]